MMSASLQTIDLAVEHVRKPGEWLPGLRVHAFECPNHPGPGKSSLDGRIFRDESRVINIGKIVMRQRPVENQSAQRQSEADGNSQLNRRESCRRHAVSYRRFHLLTSSSGISERKREGD